MEMKRITAMTAWRGMSSTIQSFIFNNVDRLKKDVRAGVSKRGGSVFIKDPRLHSHFQTSRPEKKVLGPRIDGKRCTSEIPNRTCTQ